MDEQARYDQARRHVQELKGFYRHLAIIAHAVSVFGGSRFLGKDWEEKKIREFIDKKR